MLILLCAAICAIAAVHAMNNGNVAATVFYCFCLNWIKDCFVITDEEGDEDG